MPTLGTDDALTWALATFQFGADFTLPPGATERAP